MRETKQTIAVRYARVGWPIFPVASNGKRPATPNGYHDATTNWQDVEKWWDRSPDYNIGVALPVGMAVIDCDSAAAYARLKLRLHGLVRQTLRVKTVRGVHVYFRYDALPPGVTQRQNAMGREIDIRIGGKGYVIAPGSRIGDCDYRLIQPSPGYRPGEVTQWPEGLVPLAGHSVVAGR